MWSFFILRQLFFSRPFSRPTLAFILLITYGVFAISVSVDITGDNDIVRKFEFLELVKSSVQRLGMMNSLQQTILQRPDVFEAIVIHLVVLFGGTRQLLLLAFSLIYTISLILLSTSVKSTDQRFYLIAMLILFSPIKVYIFRFFLASSLALYIISTAKNRFSLIIGFILIALIHWSSILYALLYLLSRLKMSYILLGLLVLVLFKDSLLVLVTGNIEQKLSGYLDSRYIEEMVKLRSEQRWYVNGRFYIFHSLALFALFFRSSLIREQGMKKFLILLFILSITTLEIYPMERFAFVAVLSFIMHLDIAKFYSHLKSLGLFSVSLGLSLAILFIVEIRQILLVNTF